ncbi:MAG: hypothetical protein WDN69_15865 [Aliidongia sp.]
MAAREDRTADDGDECGGLEFGASYTGIASFDEAGKLCGLSRATTEGDLRLALLNHNLVGSTSCVLARRNLLLQIGGFDAGLRSCQDWDLWIRLAANTRFTCVAEPLTVLHIAREGRISSTARRGCRVICSSTAPILGQPSRPAGSTRRCSGPISARSSCSSNGQATLPSNSPRSGAPSPGR